MKITLPIARKGLVGKIIKLQCKSTSLFRRFICVTGIRLEKITPIIPYELGEDKIAVFFYSWIEIDDSGKPIPKKKRNKK